MKSGSRNPLFQFQGYQLFRANRDDEWLAKLWTEMDPHHRETTKPDFWLTHEPGVESYLLRDREGYLYFARLQRHNLIARRMPHQEARLWASVELHIQFGPAIGERYLPPDLDRPPTHREIGAMKAIERDRVIAGLVRGLEWLELVLSGTGTSVLFFNSENPHLIRFAVKRLRFRQEGAKLIKWIIPSPGIAQKTGTGS